jgi:hypothetical protein
MSDHGEGDPGGGDRRVARMRKTTALSAGEPGPSTGETGPSFRSSRPGRGGGKGDGIVPTTRTALTPKPARSDLAAHCAGNSPRTHLPAPAPTLRAHLPSAPRPAAPVDLRTRPAPAPPAQRTHARTDGQRAFRSPGTSGTEIHISPSTAQPPRRHDEADVGGTRLKPRQKTSSLATPPPSGAYSRGWTGPIALNVSWTLAPSR